MDKDREPGTGNGKRETLADIVADMRDRAVVADRHGETETSNESVAALLRDIANRIEAAGRERNRQYEPKCDWSIKDALALANTLANHGLRDGNADAASSCIYSLCRILSAPGNAAAMRVALVRCATLGEYCFQDIHAEVAKVARAALAAPARNCDRFCNTAQALGAYRDGPPIGEEWGGGDWMQLLDWLFAPAKEGGAQ